MWVFTVDGFYSVVQKPADRKRNVIVIRSRCRDDLERMLKRVKRKDKIVESRLTDYPFRVFTSKDVWARYLSLAAEAIDYGNFKDKITEVLGPERHNVYASIWSTLLRLQAPHRTIKDDRRPGYD